MVACIGEASTMLERSRKQLNQIFNLGDSLLYVGMLNDVYYFRALYSYLMFEWGENS